MNPGSGVEAQHGDQVRTATVKLVQAQRVPGRRGAFLTAKVQGVPSEDVPLLFEPSRPWLESSGVEVEQSLLHPDADGLVYIPVSNPTAQPDRFPIGEEIGQAEVVDTEQGALVQEVTSCWDIPEKDGGEGTAGLETSTEVTTQMKLALGARKQKTNFDRRAKLKEFAAGDRVMVFMPHEQTGKKRKLARPYFGPY